MTAPLTQDPFPLRFENLADAEAFMKTRDASKAIPPVVNCDSFHGAFSTINLKYSSAPYEIRLVKLVQDQ